MLEPQPFEMPVANLLSSIHEGGSPRTLLEIHNGIAYIDRLALPEEPRVGTPRTPRSWFPD